MSKYSLKHTSGTRRKIVELLKRNGQSDATALAEILDISSMAIRQHLYALVEEGLVNSTTSPEGIGRPSKQWQLTEAANAFFPQGYAELTADLLANMREVFGDEGVNKVIELRSRDQQIAYHKQLGGSNSLLERLELLAEIRSKEGYMAEVQKRDNGFLFIENHCPICAAAQTCTGLCAAELMVFRAVLGDEVTIERCEHILQGARRCAYRVIEHSA